MTIRIIILFALAVFGFSCVEEFQPELDEFENLLVIDGGITNEEGPYTIKLSNSSGLDIINVEPVTGAEVVIFEQNGIAETLTETEAGVYQTAIGGIQGTPGRKYRLQVKVNGNTYESDYELLKTPTTIESVEPVVEHKAFPDAPEVVPGYQFYVNSGASPYPEDYYLWTQEGTYKYKSNLLIYYVYEGVLRDFEDPDSLKTCYRTYRVGEVFTTNTENLTTPIVVDQPLHFLAAVDRKLTHRYTMLTKQYSISKEAYQFWHSIEQQTANLGSLYAAQPYQIRGNLKNVNDPDEPVLGYFLVAGVSENRVFVDPVPGVDIFFEDCALDYLAYGLIFFTGPSEWPIYVTQGEGGGRALSTPGCMDCRVLGGVLDPPDFWIE